MKVEVNKEYRFSKEQLLWKYLDLHRLIYFLNTENLFFSPLSSFNDPMEGVTEKELYSKLEWDKQNGQGSEARDNVKARRNASSNGEAKKASDPNDFRAKLDQVQRTFFASCWYCGTRESLAMWDAYSNNDSVAIKFNPTDLCQRMISLSSEIDHDDFTMMVHGKVDYFKITPFEPGDKTLRNCGHRFKGFLKDVSYKHEEEFRFLVFQSGEKKKYDYFEFPFGPLDECSFSIITHPSMEPWKYNNIYKILENKALEDRLARSDIPTRKVLFDIP
jgi:hypothetical protein